jgi:hypothetical protein
MTAYALVENFSRWTTENFGSERLANASGTLRLPCCGALVAENSVTG